MRTKSSRLLSTECGAVSKRHEAKPLYWFDRMATQAVGRSLTSEKCRATPPTITIPASGLEVYRIKFGKAGAKPRNATYCGAKPHRGIVVMQLQLIFFKRNAGRSLAVEFTRLSHAEALRQSLSF